MTYFEDVVDFYENFEIPAGLPDGVAIHNPFHDAQRRDAIERFYEKFFSDGNARIHLLGINPSKINQTSTGINYTDGFALEEFCGLQNGFSRGRELTSDFFYRVVLAMGGAEEFYARIFAWAMMPLSVTSSGGYVNYYDEDLEGALSDVVRQNVKWTSERPSTGRALIVGTGENKKVFENLDGTPFGYNDVKYLPHPRWIMQYNRNSVDKYVGQYVDALS